MSWQCTTGGLMEECYIKTALEASLRRVGQVWNLPATPTQVENLRHGMAYEKGAAG
jgi:hypothetical protein